MKITTDDLARLTKARLVDEVQALSTALAEMQKETPRRATEATVLAACIDALESLKQAERDARTTTRNDWAAGLMPNSYGPLGRPTWAPGDRILRYLAARFGVSLIDVEHQDCQRPHLDTLNADALIESLRAAATK